jgi:hypothetical protein
MGNTDMAMQYLNQGYREHTEQLLRLQLNPAYDDMRTDPRFQELIHRIGLPQQFVTNYFFELRGNSS